MTLTLTTIRAKLLLIFFALAVAPLVTVGVVSYYNSVSSIEEVVENRNRAAAQELFEDIDRLVEPRYAEVGLLSWNQDIQDFYAATAAGATPTARDIDDDIGGFFGQMFTAEREAFAQVRYLDSAGQLLFRYGRAPETVSAYSAVETPAATTTFGFAGSGGTIGYTFATSDSLYRGLDLDSYRRRDDGLYVTNAFSPNYGHVIRLGAEVRDTDDENTLGYLLADIEIGRILEQTRALQTAGTDQYPVILERDNSRVIYHPDRRLVGQLVDRAVPVIATSLDPTSIETSAHYTEDGVEKLISFVDHPELNWSVGTVTHTGALIGPVRDTGLRNLAITLGSVFLALILLPLTIGRISRSIRQVTEGAEAIAAGDLDQEIEVDSKDETGILANTFNHMATSLRTTMQELQNLTQELEDRVQRRTAELEDVNTRLEGHNRELEIERVLERVRTQVAAMEKPDDLGDLSETVESSLKQLDVPLTSLGINTVDNEGRIFTMHYYRGQKEWSFDLSKSPVW